MTRVPSIAGRPGDSPAHMEGTVLEAGKPAASGGMQAGRCPLPLNLPFGAQLGVRYLPQHVPGGVGWHRSNVFAARVGPEPTDVLWCRAPTAVALQALKRDSEQHSNAHGFMSYHSPSETRQPAGHVAHVKQDAFRGKMTPERLWRGCNQ